MAEDDARRITISGVNKIKDLAEIHLPRGVERSRRVFMPEAMFSTTRRSGRGIRRRHDAGGAIVAGGICGLGIGLAQQNDLLETTFADIVDLNHHALIHFGDGKEGDEESSTSTALGFLSIGIGALTMVGGQALGLRGLIEGVVRVADLMGRKWTAPVLGAFTIGMTAYLIIDLPTSIPRTVGRRVKASILSRDREVNFVDAHAARVGRETRKVLRLASWELKGIYRGAMDERVREVTGAEQREKKALKAKEWFSDVDARTDKIRAEAELQNIDA
jgi:mitofusin